MLTDTYSTLHHLVEVKVMSRGLTLFDVNKMNISTVKSHFIVARLNGEFMKSF